jgi:hypothetical protein
LGPQQARTAQQLRIASWPPEEKAARCRGVSSCQCALHRFNSADTNLMGQDIQLMVIDAKEVRGRAAGLSPTLSFPCAAVFRAASAWLVRGCARSQATDGGCSGTVPVWEQKQLVSGLEPTRAPSLSTFGSLDRMGATHSPDSVRPDHVRAREPHLYRRHTLKLTIGMQPST